jgi:hypothetical protein
MYLTSGRKNNEILSRKWHCYRALAVRNPETLFLIPDLREKTKRFLPQVQRLRLGRRPHVSLLLPFSGIVVSLLRVRKQGRFLAIFQKTSQKRCVPLAISGRLMYLPVWTAPAPFLLPKAGL